MGAELIANARDLERDLDWFATVLEARLKAYFDRAADKCRFYLPPPPLEGTSPYAGFLSQHQVDPRVRLIVLLALIPHVRPQLLDVLCTRNETTQRHDKGAQPDERR